MPSRLPYKRAERVADLLRQVLSEMFMSKIHHEGLEEVTVTSVKITDDLQHAKVFYRVFDSAHRVKFARQLSKMAKFLRREAGRQLKMKYTPDLTFEYDESLEYGHRIDSLLASVTRKESDGEE